MLVVRIDYSIATNIWDLQFQYRFPADFSRDVSVSKDTLERLPAFSERRHESKYFDPY